MRSPIFNDDQTELFQDDELDVDVSYFQHQRPIWRKLREMHALKNALLETIDGPLSIFCINKAFSWGCLDIDSDSFNNLLDNIGVFPQYDRLVRAFSSRIRDRNSVNLILETACSKEPDSRSSYEFEICYNLYYVQKNHRRQGCPWSVRELGVYHKLDLATMRSRWIFIQTEQTVRKFWEQTRNVDSLSPMRVHVLLLRYISGEWTECIDYWDAEIEALDEKAFHSDLEVVDVDYSATFADCQHLQTMQKKIQKLQRAIECLLALAQSLHDSWATLAAFSNSQKSKEATILSVQSTMCFRVARSELQSHKKNIDAIMNRSISTGELLAKLLEFRKMDETQGIHRGLHRSMLALEDISRSNNETAQLMVAAARETRRDSMTLKALTLIATVYLPATLIATIFSSNLVQTVPIDREETSNTRLKIANTFWVFVVATLGCMFCTVIVFMLLRYTWRRSERPKPFKLG